MKKEKKPGLFGAIKKEYQYNLIVLEYIWPFFAVIFGIGFLLIYLGERGISFKFVREIIPKGISNEGLESFIIVLVVFIALGINYLYYRWYRNR